MPFFTVLPPGIPSIDILALEETSCLQPQTHLVGTVWLDETKKKVSSIVIFD